MDSRILPPVGFCSPNTQDGYFFPVSNMNPCGPAFPTSYQQWMPHYQYPVDLDSIYRGNNQTAYRQNNLHPDYRQYSVFNLRSVSHQALGGTVGQNAVILVSISGLPNDNLIKSWIGHQHCNLARFWICPAAHGDTTKKAFLELSNVDEGKIPSPQLLRSTDEITIEKVSKACDLSLSIQLLIKIFQSRLRHSRQSENRHFPQPSSNCKYEGVTSAGEIGNAAPWDIFGSSAYFQKRTIDKWCFDYAASSETFAPFVVIKGFPTAFGYRLTKIWIRGKFETQGATIRIYQTLGRIELQFKCSLVGKQAAEHALSVFDGLKLAGQFLRARLFKRKVRKNQQVQTQQRSAEPHAPIVIAHGSSCQPVQSQQRSVESHAPIVIAHGSSRAHRRQAATS